MLHTAIQASAYDVPFSFCRTALLRHKLSARLPYTGPSPRLDQQHNGYMRYIVDCRHSSWRFTSSGPRRSRRSVETSATASTGNADSGQSSTTMVVSLLSLTKTYIKNPPLASKSCRVKLIRLIRLFQLVYMLRPTNQKNCILPLIFCSLDTATTSMDWLCNSL